jgi:hypothetical protein
MAATAARWYGPNRHAAGLQPVASLSPGCFCRVPTIGGGGGDIMAFEAKAYMPQWLRLPEAISHIGKLSSLNEAAAKAWLMRAMKDRLRGDHVRYNEQQHFRIAGYPMRRTTAAKAYDWPADIRPDDFDWENSTVWGADPVRIIGNKLLIEVSADALSREFSGGQAAPTSANSRKSGRKPKPRQAAAQLLAALNNEGWNTNDEPIEATFEKARSKGYKGSERTLRRAMGRK